MSAHAPAESHDDATAAILGTLNRLIIDACRSDSLKALHFFIVNETASLFPYDRAILWDLRGRTPEPVSASGQEQVNPDTQLASDMRQLIPALRGHDTGAAQCLTSAPSPETADAWSRLTHRTGDTQILWLPLQCHGEMTAGLWLERWEETEWSEEEIQLLEVLSDGYGAALEHFDRRIFGHRLAASGSSRRRIHLAVAAALLYLLFLHPFRLRVVAPCEVAPADPVIVTAPIEGVIQDIEVAPGKRVHQNDLLFTYDPHAAREEYVVAQQQVAIVRADLEEKRSRAFEDNDALNAVAILSLRLQQEEARLALAEWRVRHLEVEAPAAGEVVIENPDEWPGRPVRVGERILQIVHPGETKVRIWIPESDNVTLDPSAAGKVFLNVRPAESLAVSVSYVSPKAAPSPTHVSSFLADADWQAPPDDVRIGLKGTAVLYGPRVSLAYWLARKPLAACRRWLGL